MTPVVLLANHVTLLPEPVLVYEVLEEFIVTGLLTNYFVFRFQSLENELRFSTHPLTLLRGGHVGQRT